jgi:hypothetical protein
VVNTGPGVDPIRNALSRSTTLHCAEAIAKLCIAHTVRTGHYGKA